MGLASYFFSLILVSVVSLAAKAADEKCIYSERVDNAIFRALPPEIIGWAKCEKISGQLNIIYIARLTKTNHQDLMTFFRKYEHSTSPEKSVATIVSETNNDLGVWLEIAARRSVGPVSHFLFTISGGAGKRLVFIYSDFPGQAKNLSGFVHTARIELSKMSRIRELEKQ